MSERPTSHRLTPAELFRLPRAQGTIVRVRCGTVWLREQDDWRDHFLSRTQSYRIRDHGLVLIGAANPKVIEFDLVPPNMTIHMKEST